MSDKPEPLAAILAEMRDFADHRAADAGGERPAIELLRSFADRIDAAAERERNEHTNDIHNALYMATGIPGNAAALREALNLVGHLANDLRNITERDTEVRADVNEIVDVCRAALTAPARNCDRFATAVEAMEEWGKYPQSRYKGCRLCPHGDASMVSPAHLTLAEWLFAPAEGGDHA